MAHPKISYGLMFLALGGLTISKLIRGSTKDLCGDKQFCILIVEWLHESTYVKNCIKLHTHTQVHVKLVISEKWSVGYTMSISGAIILHYTDTHVFQMYCTMLMYDFTTKGN